MKNNISKCFTITQDGAFKIIVHILGTVDIRYKVNIAYKKYKARTWLYGGPEVTDAKNKYKHILNDEVQKLKIALWENIHPDMQKLEEDQ